MGPEPAQQVIQTVRAFANPARAERDRQYHESARPHWGINMPQLDSVVKRHVKQHTARQGCCNWRRHCGTAASSI